MPMVEGEYVCLSVADTGLGIPREVIDQVFEPFFTTKPVGQGTGLGLSTVYGIVKQSDGYVWPYSEVGAGTTFKIYLPRDGSPRGSATGPPERIVHAASGGESILLVEDDARVRAFAANVLGRAGYNVIEAAGPADALERARELPFDLLLTDVVMPGMSGLTLAHEIAGIASGVRIAFTSGYSEATIGGHGIPEGTPYLPKPFSVAALLGTVRRALDGGGTGNSIGRRPTDGNLARRN